MMFFFFKQKTAYEMRISDWSSDVCSSDLRHVGMEFAAGMSVFPGGGVDDRDSELDPALWAGPSPEEWAERMGCNADEAKELICAAVRELGRASCRERVCQYV